MKFTFLLKQSRGAPTSEIIFALAVLMTITETTSAKKPQNPPRILLKSFTKTDGVGIEQADSEFGFYDEYSNDLILKNGSVFSFLSDVKKAYFVCEAEYPIQWNLPIPQQFSDGELNSFSIVTAGARQSYFNENMKTPENQMFYAYLELSFMSFNFINGNFTCEPLHHHTSSSSDKQHHHQPRSSSTGVYVFSEGEKAINGQGSTLHVNVTKTDKTVILPCRPALHNMQVTLFKKKEKTEEWVELPLSKTPQQSTSFNPMIGFTLISRNIVGLYKCALTDEKDVSVMVQVSRGEKLDRSPVKLQMKQNLSTESAKVVGEKDCWKCCNGVKGKSMTISKFDCANLLQCEMMKAIWMHVFRTDPTQIMRTYSPVNSDEGCFVADVFYTATVVTCQSSVMDVAVQYLAVYDSEETVANKSKHDYWNMRESWVDLNYRHLYDVSLPNEPSIEEKITFRVASQLKNSKFRGNPDTTVAYVLHNPDWESHYLSKPDAEDDRGGGGEGTTYLTVHNWEIFEGEEIFLICYSLRFYYSRGGWLRIKWKNGTRTMLKGHVNSEEDAVSYMEVVEEKDNTVISGMIKTDFNMSSVECHVPRLDSDKWEWREFKLNIQRTTPPKFTHAQEETLILEMSESGQVSINCSLSEGEPTPKIRWEKDGKKINWKHGIETDAVRTSVNISSYTVKFLNITQELQGEYHCVAENMRGKAVKTFTIRVAGLPGFGGYLTFHIALIIVAATVTASMMLTLIVVVAKYIRRNK